MILLSVPPRLAASLEALRRRYSLFHKIVLSERLHLTLWVSWDYDAPQRALIELCEAAMDSAALPSCKVKLSRIEIVAAWAGIKPRRPHTDLDYLQRCVAGACRCYGIPERPGFDFDPHITLAYHSPFAMAAPISELAWTPSEIVLVESHVGRGKHVVLGRWPLGTAPARLQHELAFA